MDLDLIIKNGRVVTPSGERRLDIGVRDGKIAVLQSEIETPAERTIDARDLLVFPGFIDAHTHMGIPIMNTQSVDDFASGSVAAAFGGVTTIFDFTVQEPEQMLKDSVEVRIAKAQGKSHVDFGLHVNITDEPEMHLWEIPELVDEGFTSFKVFSTYREAGMMVTWGQFEQIMQKVHSQDGLLMLHAEDNGIIESMQEDFKNQESGLPILHALSRPPDAESMAIYRAAQIAEELGAYLYIVHLSSWDGLEAAAEARSRGVNIYVETCPQYLVLNESRYTQADGHYWITTPPLRGKEDSDSLWQAIADGFINVVGTDHCPFTKKQKDSGKGVFYRTPNGLPGVETLFPLMYTYGVAQKRISLQRLVELLAKNPARIFGIYPRKGAIQIGSDADLVIWDPKGSHMITAEKLHGKADWSPYEGMEIKGKLEYTILRGQILVEGDRFVGQNVFGELLRSR